MFEIGFEDIAPQFEFGELSLADDGDQAGRLQLFHMVGERGRAHRIAAQYVRARHAACLCADLFKDFVTARVGQGLVDELNLCDGKYFPFHCLHHDACRS